MQNNTNLQKRRYKVRNRIYRTSDRPRLSVFRSNKHIYAQIIDDNEGKVLAHANDYNIEEKNSVKRAELVGEELGKVALANKVNKVVFDRGGRKYHGRIKAVADGARKSGLSF